MPFQIVQFLKNTINAHDKITRIVPEVEEMNITKGMVATNDE